MIMFTASVAPLLAVGPMELILLFILLGLFSLFLYAIYRLGYRVGKAEGIAQERPPRP